VALTDVTDLKLHFSGFASLTGYIAGEVLFTGLEGNTVHLSKPLPKDLGKAGDKVACTTFKYRPFSGPTTLDYRNTMTGWQRYVSRGGKGQ